MMMQGRKTAGLVAMGLALVAIATAPAWAAEALVRVEINKGAMVRLPEAVSSVVMADPNTADVQVISPKLLFINGKKVGETSVYAVNSQDETIYNATIEVTHNLSKLERMVKKVAPDAEVGFNTIDGGLVMDGVASSPVESENIRNMASAFVGANEKMVNMMTTTGSDQVNLQVKVVEMSRSDVKKFGINLQAAFQPYDALGISVLQGESINLAGGILDRGGSTDTTILGQFVDGNTSISSVIDALETQGLVHTLAEPNLTTTSGKTANFLAGGEFPITINSGNDTVSVEYKPFGVSLNFTPVVLSKNKISITVAPEVSTISFDNPIETDGIRNPIILTRKAEATVELGSGQTFALAGLLKNENSNSINKFPGLGDVPVLGTLFRSQEFQNNQTELVILVTPYIVRPVSDKKMQTPEMGYTPPNDLQRLLLGNLYQQEPLVEDGAMPQLQGDGGFMLEE